MKHETTRANTPSTANASRQTESPLRELRDHRGLFFGRIQWHQNQRRSIDPASAALPTSTSLGSLCLLQECREEPMQLPRLRGPNWQRTTMKILNLQIQNCTQCPHFSQFTISVEKPSCKYAKSSQFPKSLPHGEAKIDPFHGGAYYEATGEIPDWCPLPDASPKPKAPQGSLSSPPCTCLTNQLGPHYCERHAP